MTDLDPALVEKVAAAIYERQFDLSWRNVARGSLDHDLFTDVGRAAIMATLSHLSPTIPVVRFKEPTE